MSKNKDNVKHLENRDQNKKKFWFYFLNALCWSIIGGLLIICGLQFADKKSGFRVLKNHTAVVVSESMSTVNPSNLYYLPEDTEHIQIGDIIKAKEYKSFDDVKLLDVVIYNGQDGLLICHRVVDKYVDPVKGECLVTRGDANSSDDTPVKFEIVRGKVIQVTPKLGKLILFMQSPYMLIGLFGSGFFVLLGFLIAGFNKEKKNKKDNNNSGSDNTSPRDSKGRFTSSKTVQSITLPIILAGSVIGLSAGIGAARALFTKTSSTVSFGIGATPAPIEKNYYLITSFENGSGDWDTSSQKIFVYVFYTENSVTHDASFEMHWVENRKWEVTVPLIYDTIIFCRVNPSYESFAWDSRVYNQTENLDFVDDKDTAQITCWHVGNDSSPSGVKWVS